MCVKKRGIWYKYGWAEYFNRVKLFSLGMVSLGLKRGDVVCVIGDNEPEWFWAEFAVQAAGGIATGAYVDSVPSELKYIASHSGACFAVANDQEQADKFLEILPELPGLKKVIYWDPKGLNNYDDPLLVSFEKVIEMGEAYGKEHPGLFDENMNLGKADDTAFIYYTSGTTGLPKGAILTHRALIQTAHGFVSAYPLSEKDDLVSNFPAAWVGDSYFATIPHILTGARLNFAEEPETIAADTREVGPDFAIYGPRQWESLVSEIQVKMTDAHPLKRFAYNLLIPIGYKIADLNFQGVKPDIFWKNLHKVAHYLLLRPLKDRLGLKNVRFAVTGSSVLSLDTFKLIHAVGIELRQTYASTEAGFISSHNKGEIDFQSVGRPAVGVEVRITGDGELLVRSDCTFKEYLNEPEKTARVKKDGWCYTGDAVNINENGHLIFLDRLEHMGVLVTGARYAPQYIEGRLRFSPYIKDAMVIGGKDKSFVAAIVNIDFAMVGKWAERKGITYTTFVDLSQRQEVAELIKKDLVRVNSYLPELSRVKRYMLLHKEFDPDEAELTRTRKLRREFMEIRYKPVIDAVYGNKDSLTVDASITYRDGRKGTVSTMIRIWDI
jgi:long-chain acyl-CoA synthetase